MEWKINNLSTIFKNRFIHLLEKKSVHPHLGAHNYYCIEFPDWVNIVAITKEKDLILVKQYRHGLEETILETPGGVVDPGEDPLETAQRELLEETGYQGKIISLGKVAANPAIQNNYCHIFLCTDCVEVSKQNLDPTEQIEIEKVPYNKVQELIENGQIFHSLSVVSLLKSKIYLDNAKNN